MATEITALCKKQYGPSGDIHKYAVKLEGLVGTTTGTTVVNVAENPFGEDMIILEAYTDVLHTATADADMDIGLADSSAGANHAAEIVDSLVDNATGVKAYLLHTLAADGVALVVWKAANAAHTAADSWIATYQTNTSASSDLVFNLTLVVCRKSVFD
jgi:hypothetical protein